MIENNKIYNMDCIEGMKQMPDNSVDYSFTSPPYNVGKRYHWDTDMYKEYDDTKEDYFSFLKDVIDEMMRVTRYQVFLNIGYCSNNKEAVFKIIGLFSNKIKDIMIWDKGYNGNVRNESCISHNAEFIIVFDKDKADKFTYQTVFGYRGDIKQVINIPSNNPFFEKEAFNIEGHNAIMNIKLARHFIHYFTKKEDIVLDPFMGSGTTAVVCKQLGRQYIGFEISKEYCQTINRRLSQNYLGF